MSGAVSGASIAAAVVLFGTFDFLVDMLMVKLAVPPGHHAGVQATIMGVGAGGAIWLILLGNRERRRRVADELRRVAELNHTVRNSLEVIAHAHYLSGVGEDHKRMMDRAVCDIDAKLKELFPVLGARARG